MLNLWDLHQLHGFPISHQLTGGTHSGGLGELIEYRRDTTYLCQDKPRLTLPCELGAYFGYKAVLKVRHWLQKHLQVNCIFRITGRIRYCISHVLTSQEPVLALPHTCAVSWGKLSAVSSSEEGKNVPCILLNRVMSIKNVCPATLVSTAFASLSP